MKQEEYKDLQNKIVTREKLEDNATAIETTEILKQLNISIDALPQKCQQLLQEAADTQQSMEIDILDPIAISLHHTLQISDKLEDEYEILKLRQKNQELQTKIDRNNKFLEDLRNELNGSKKSLMACTPNPEGIQEQIRQMRLKVASYEESCDKARTKYSKLSVPEGVLPKSLMSLVSTLASLKEEELTLKQRADDVRLAREARDTFNRLRRQ